MGISRVTRYGTVGYRAKVARAWAQDRDEISLGQFATREEAASALALWYANNGGPVQKRKDVSYVS